MPHAVIQESTARENVLLNHTLNITPVDAPLFAWPKESRIRPQDYLKPYEVPFGRRVAEWQNAFFGLQDQNPRYRSECLVQPLRPDAPTVVVIFYPDYRPTGVESRSVDSYLERLARLASMQEQTIVYTSPSSAPAIRALRDDAHWLVVDDYETVWDIPSNRHQQHNFGEVQPRIFDAFERKPGVDGWEPEPRYSDAHRSACYNAKAFVSYDAVMRNPFGSDRWMYADAGLFDECGPVADGDGGGKPWGAILAHRLSTAKFDRSIAVSGDSGVAMGEYMQSLAYGGIKDINHAGWTDATRSWMCQHFIAQAYVGSSLGMLNYSVRFMQTVDDMDANGFYTAREEFVMQHVAVRYPNTIFSIPWMPVEGGKWQHVIKGCYSTYGGEESVPAIGDPIEGTICKGYKAPRSHVEGRGIYQWFWRKRLFAYGPRYTETRLSMW